MTGILGHCSKCKAQEGGQMTFFDVTENPEVFWKSTAL
jgi:hypothetical protein